MTDTASHTETPDYRRKARRTNRMVAALCVLAAALLVAAGVAAKNSIEAGQNAAVQFANETPKTAVPIGPAEENETQPARLTIVPNLVDLLGLTPEEAVEALQRGAQITATEAVGVEGSAVRTRTTITLTEEAGTALSGTPTVEVGFSEDGVIVQAGYSASTLALGYGALSFSDAVLNENVVERTLTEAGVPVDAGTVELPQDRSTYSTYATDGTTLVNETCSFSGTAQVNGVPRAWEATLEYDYTTANATGNLANTVRLISVRVE